MNILQVRIPGEIDSLNSLLASPFYADSFVGPSNSTAAGQQQNSLAVQSFNPLSVLEVPTNDAVVCLLDELEEKLVRNRKHACDMEQWLMMSIRKLETGCELKTKVLNMALEMVRRLKNDTRVRRVAVATYHYKRVKLLRRLMNNPGFDDAVLAVEKYDTVHLDIFKMYAVQMKNRYEELLHFFQLYIDYIV